MWEKTGRTTQNMQETDERIPDIWKTSEILTTLSNLTLVPGLAVKKKRVRKSENLGFCTKNHTFLS